MFDTDSGSLRAGGDSSASKGRLRRSLRLSISKTMLLIFLAIICLSGAAVVIVGNWVQDRSVHEIAAAESKRTAGLIFQHLYSVMRKGWTSEEVRDVITRINATLPDVHVLVVRSEQVARQFGEDDENRKLRLQDAIVAQSLADGQERLISEGETLRFVYPLPVQDECVGCHSNAMPGSINGVIDIHFPVSKLRVPLEFTMHTVISVFVVVFLVLFVLVLANVRFLIAKPIIKLTQDIDAIVKSHDLTKRAQGRSFLWLHEVRSLAGNFNRMMAKLQHSHEELSRLSITDPLTGLKNRRHFEELFAEELLRAERYRHQVALIMIDLDGFKAVNDTWGHAVGDEILRRVAHVMSSHVRTVDIVTRLGGDEFAVLVPETGREGAANLAAKLSELISAQRIEMDGGKFASVGASAGIATYPEDGASQEDVKKCADDAMYEEKKLRKAKHQ